MSKRFNFGHGDRPKVRPERSFVDLLCNVAALLSVLAGIVLVAAAWPTLPETIPIHFNASGEAVVIAASTGGLPTGNGVRVVKAERGKGGAARIKADGTVEQETGDSHSQESFDELWARELGERHIDVLQVTQVYYIFKNLTF